MAHRRRPAAVPGQVSAPTTTDRLAIIQVVRALVTIYALIVVAGLGLYIVVGLTHG